MRQALYAILFGIALAVSACGGGESSGIPGGARIAFLACAAEDYCNDQLVVLDASGNREQVSEPQEHVAAYSWSPDGRWLAYFATGGPGPRLVFVADGDRTILNLDGLQPTPPIAWSADSRRVAFAATATDGAEIRLYGATAGVIGAVHLASLPGSSGFPTFSPELDKLAFIDLAKPQASRTEPTTEDSYDLWIARIDGLEKTRVTNDEDAELWPSWSPDGRQLAYVASPRSPGGSSIKAVHLDDMTVRTLVSGLTGPPETLAWAPDAGSIAYDGAMGAGDLFVTTLDVPDTTLLTEDGPGCGRPSWSPDGFWLACVSLTAAQLPDVFVVKKDGTGLTNVTRTDDIIEHSATWAPDQF
jgi:Tol biopolymer transport system component